VVDWIICLLVAVPFGYPRHLPWLPLVVLVIYYAGVLGPFGWTVGMRVTRLRCLGYVDGLPVGVSRGFVRGLGLALFVPALIMDHDRRGLHDRLAGTVVVVDSASDRQV
jgi:uncharacterized RDD family membrane protein YckC